LSRFGCWFFSIFLGVAESGAGRSLGCDARAESKEAFRDDELMTPATHGGYSLVMLNIYHPENIF